VGDASAIGVSRLESRGDRPRASALPTESATARTERTTDVNRRAMKQPLTEQMRSLVSALSIGRLSRREVKSSLGNDVNELYRGKLRCLLFRQLDHAGRKFECQFQAVPMIDWRSCRGAQPIVRFASALSATRAGESPLRRGPYSILKSLPTTS
jgi:hypothetical protein